MRQGLGCYRFYSMHSLEFYKVLVKDLGTLNSSQLIQLSPTDHFCLT